MFGRRESLRELVRNLHEENLRHQERRDEESRQREQRLEELVEGTREFNREILLRNEKVYTRLIVEVDENTKQIRASTEAVLRLLDRFDEPGGATA